MINVSFTVEEALNIVKMLGCGDAHDKIVKAITFACEIKSLRYVLTVHSIPQGKYVQAVKVLRDCMNWGLLEAKNWMDVVRGKPHDKNDGSYYYIGGRANVITIEDDLIANTLFTKLTELGVDVTMPMKHLPQRKIP